MVDDPNPEAIVHRMLRAIGEDPDRPGLVETPRRVVDSWEELFSGYKASVKDVFKTFEAPDDSMVTMIGLEFFSHCEHHMIPFFGQAHIGYIPNGKVIGISKLARLVDIFARRLQMQERMGPQIADAIMLHLKPQGCGVVLEAKHLCMMGRGVGKQNSVLLTSTVRGSFLTNSQVNREFQAHISRRA